MSKTQREDTRHRWYYENESKDVEGPFSTARMTYWMKKKFLPKNLNVKYTSVGKWRRLNTIQNKDQVFDEASWTRFNKTIRIDTTTSTQKSSNKKLDWYYEDEKGICQGPFGSRQMQYWLKKGYLKPVLKVKSVPRGGDDSPRHTHKWMRIQNLPQPAFSTEVPIVVQSPTSKPSFFYKDEHGEIRGPYVIYCVLRVPSHTFHICFSNSHTQTFIYPVSSSVICRIGPERVIFMDR